MDVLIKFKKFSEEKPVYSGRYLVHLDSRLEIMLWWEIENKQQWFRVSFDVNADLDEPLAEIHHKNIWWAEDIMDLHSFRINNK